ncbi:AAA family ATPase [Haliscomenobacter hydrossis]|uniref:Uncharacterized protein n=1 Tax=Haliscomenobacter hydrossis (strain ATCC 27775 / DSM 1100 / LMG 10767 / O) TaxID=760192 RepID=F4L862_HALH1|nr:AAA family ATPase [Haliscomenobacter hydrossis]AEE54570.1 hypothetical protein Halhy_6756 [Haliscomenobacter hydrossis DSM 1100]
MELLYIWIKSYKNIIEQGFNFSPQWRFHYNPHSGILKSDHLEQATPDFFGPSISNVTVIVGENGSGKSNLVEFIIRLFDQGTGFWNEPFIVIYRMDKILRVWCYQDLPLNVADEQYGFSVKKSIFKMRKLEAGLYGGITAVNEIDEITFAYYSQYFDGVTPRFGLNRNNNFLDLSNRRNIVRPKSEHSLEETFLSPKHYYYNNIKRQAKLFSNWGRHLLDFPVPDFIKITVNEDINREYLKNAFKDDRGHGSEEIWDFFDRPGFIFEIFRAVLFSTLLDVCARSGLGENSIGHLKQRINEDQVKQNPLVLLEKVQNDAFGKWRSMHEFIQWLSVECTPFFYENEPDPIFKTRDNALILPTNSPLISIFFTHIDYIDIQISSPFHIAWTFKDDQDREAGLSSGFNNLINLFARIFAIWEKLVHTNTFLLFIDEGEVGLHPELQKRYLDLLLNNIPRIFPIMDPPLNFKIQLILTSHSPFMVSDLPRENIIFLERNPDGTCKVSDGMNDMQQTFGANIHTLLSDSFFLKRHNGLMGSFAQKRINQVIQFYQHGMLIDNLNREESEVFAQRVTDILGEPIIKRYLLQLQSLRQNINVKEDIQKLKDEIAELKKRLPND